MTVRFHIIIKIMVEMLAQIPELSMENLHSTEKQIPKTKCSKFSMLMNFAVNNFKVSSFFKSIPSLLKLITINIFITDMFDEMNRNVSTLSSKILLFNFSLIKIRYLTITRNPFTSRFSTFKKKFT